MKTVIAQFWTENLSYSKYTKLINEKYCDEQNYIYHVETDTKKIKNAIGNKAFTWYKPQFLLDVLALHNPDYVLFLDADAIVVDQENRIENFIDSTKDIVVAKDYGPSDMQAGVILIKNTPWVKDFLKRWDSTADELVGGNPPTKGFYSNYFWWDQTGFSHLLKTEPGILDKISVIDNTVFNSNCFKNSNAKNFIFHAFAYGHTPNRTIDTAYHHIFNIPLPQGIQLLDVVNHYSTDKHSEHRYFDLIYNELFRPSRTTCKTFMEIGVHNGESIKLWRDYFINAEIIGVDKDLSLFNNSQNNTSKERMTLLHMDQSNEQDLNLLKEKYANVDVILDDGSHKMRDQQITLGKLFKSLKSGGIYIIEDLHTSLEVFNPEKNIYGWGDSAKTVTLQMLKDYQTTKKFHSDYMSNEELEYLNENVKSVDVYQSHPEWSITSVIVKK